MSSVTIWEIEIKAGIGKFPNIELLRSVIDREFEYGGFQELTLNRRHAEELSNLPFHHKDPFDRILIAQALHEKLTVITRDGLFAQYPIPILKA